MCGIVGFLNKQKKKDIILKKMMNSIHHRGPDGSGTYIDDNIALGHNRLAIIDLNDGIQPQYNEDKSLVIIFNGEIYNYKELREELINKGHKFYTKSDTEVIIHAFEEWYIDCPKHLRGMFAFAIWDKTKKELFLARDAAGIKPLYYAKFNNTFMFASEIKAIIQHDDFQKEFNSSILSSYLCLGFIPNNETFFKGVFNLEPGGMILVNNNNVVSKRFFKLDFTDEGTTKEEINDVMKDSVRYHQISDVEVGSFLSSGIDSSYIVTLSNVSKTYTVGYSQENFSEISYAKELSSLLGIENKSRIITKKDYMEALPKVINSLDEPLGDPSAIAIYFLAELASKDLKVVMSGEGADELFGGYLSYLEDNSYNWYMKIPFKIRECASFVASLFPEMRGFNFIYRRGRKLEDEWIGMNRICRDKEASKLVNIKKQISTKEIVKKYYDDYRDCTDLQKRQMIDFNLILAKDFLPAIDRNCMLFGIEARTPFLDLNVFNVASKLKDTDKINKDTTKVLLRDAASDIIPNEAYKKKKLGFPVPLKVWMKEDDLFLEIKSKFLSPTAKMFFSQKKIIKLLSKYKNNKYDNYKLIWNIYVFIVWYDLYFNKAND